MRALANFNFTKYSATGNDFIVIDNRQLGLSGRHTELFQRLCRRRTGIGADGVLLVDTAKELDFAALYFNADGSPAECGNGARCVAHFARSLGLVDRLSRFQLGQQIYEAEIERHRVRLLLPPARDFNPDVGILEETEWQEAGSINTGVPHYVLFDDHVDETDVVAVGRKYRYHAYFQPHGTNVDFVQVETRGRIRVRTYERGVEAETLSCGTGSVASAFLAHHKRNLPFPVEVLTRGGALLVDRTADGERFVLEGNVQPVYEGTLIGIEDG